MVDVVVARPGFRDLNVRYKDEGDGTYAEVITLPKMDVAIEKDVNGDLVYVGVAPPGSLTSAAKWAIRKAVAAGGATVYRYAGGSTAPQIWDNRAALSYP